MKILRVKKTAFYDIFTGNGWKNHTRVHYRHHKVKYISGNILPKIRMVEISKTLGEVK